MKNIKIYSKDWLQSHPYTQSDPIDLYYTRIANHIYNILYETRLAYSFEKDDVKQIAIRMASYFEDVISHLNIWRSFIDEHKRLFGKYLPFYSTGDNYYDDEVNLEDVRFLLWHYTQQYHGARKGTFVSPDNATNEEAAQKIYTLFCNEWTTAPENEKMQALFANDTRYKDEAKYNELIHWFHYNCYLFTDSNEELTDTIKTYWKMNPAERDDNDVMVLHNSLAHFSKTAFLAYTSPKWMSLILPKTHPDHELFITHATYTQEAEPEAEPEAQDKVNEQIERFKAKAGDKLIMYFENKEDVLIYIKNELEIQEDWNLDSFHRKQLGLYTSPKEGLSLLIDGIECIKDPSNPFYNQKIATEQGIAFYMVKHVDISLLKALEERGMLNDAQAKSMKGPERSKAILHDNWQFLTRYFLRDY